MELGWIISSLLLSTRFAAASALTPVFGSTYLPSLIRVLFALTFGMVMAFCLPASAVASIGELSSTQLVASFLREILIGTAFSLGFLVAYSATQIAGRTLDVQIGFGVGGILNPATGAFSPLIGSLFGMVGIALFLAMDGHHQLIRALALSAQIAQPGISGFTINAFAILKQSSAMFAFGFMLAAPIMLVLLLVDLSLAICARSLPQLNILVLSFAIKVVISMLLLAVSLQWIQWTFAKLYQGTFDYWSQQAGTP